LKALRKLAFCSFITRVFCEPATIFSSAVRACSSQYANVYATKLLKENSETMKRDILLAKQRIVLVDGIPHRIPDDAGTDPIPKSGKKADIVKWLRTKLQKLYRKYFPMFYNSIKRINCLALVSSNGKITKCCMKLMDLATLKILIS
jgi:hypothetical protein